MCNITLPDQMVGGPFNITVGGEQPLYIAQPTSNGTHTSLYVTYNHTTTLQAVEITGTTFIPEFPITATLPMLLTTLFMTIVLLKRRQNK
jgi:hypothetical protein